MNIGPTRIFSDVEKMVDAVSNGRVNEIIEMYDNGFDINSNLRNGARALHFAIASNHIDSLRTLLALGANPNLRNGKGYTPLHMAVGHGLSDFIMELLENNADVDMESVQGETPIQRAQLNGLDYIAQILSAYSKSPATLLVMDMLEKVSDKKLTTTFDNTKEKKKDKEKEKEEPTNPLIDALENAPDEFLCPISYELMEDPVITPAGITYEREVAEDWIGKHHTEPTLRDKMPMEIKDLVPNLGLKAAIEWYKTLQKLLPKTEADNQIKMGM